MIEFHLPNFRCQVSKIEWDNNGNAIISDKKSWRYCYAESPVKAEELLKKDRSLHMHKVEPCNFIDDWKEKVESKRKEVLESVAGGKKPAFPPTWSDLKEHLTTLFHGKCGYCEAPFTAVSFGDVEHYRPKAGVEEDDKHKGYYWLAYEPTNYLPACQLCNEPAKQSHFPIKGTRAYSESDPLEKEDPLLINPYRDFYEDHLEFFPSSVPREISKPDVRPGGVKGKTDKGWASISNLRLRRDDLCDLREHEMAFACQNISLAIIKLAQSKRNAPDWDEFRYSLQKFLSEDRPFRTAVYYELRQYLLSFKWSEEDVRDIFRALGFHA